jgi:predicted metal-binding protein
MDTALQTHQLSLMSKKAKAAAATVTTVRTGWEETVLVCRKCSKRLSGGFGKDGDETLTTTLRSHLRKAGRRGGTAIIDVGCFGLCPKKAVVVARSSTPDRLIVVGAGADPALFLD